MVNVAFINADAIKTTGVDISVRFHRDTRFGVVSAWAEASTLLAYDVTNVGAKVNALGKLNRANVGAPNQRFKASLGGALSRQHTDLSLLLRHVGEYEDDFVGAIDSFTTLDLSSRFSFSRADSLWFALGIANLLDRDPPRVNIGGNYDPRSADPQGQRVYVSIGASL